MLPLGWLPAEKARNLPRPSRLRIASAMIERAEFPVQRKRTLNSFLWAASGMGYFLRWLAFGAGGQHSASRSASGRLHTSGWPSQQSVIRNATSARIPSISAR